MMMINYINLRENQKQTVNTNFFPGPDENDVIHSFISVGRHRCLFSVKLYNITLCPRIIIIIIIEVN